MPISSPTLKPDSFSSMCNKIMNIKSDSYLIVCLVRSSDYEGALKSETHLTITIDRSHHCIACSYDPLTTEG